MEWPDSQPQSPLVLPGLPVDDRNGPPRFTPKFFTGSLTGYMPWSVKFGSSYLSASREIGQPPLCANEEGWGPLSPYRWDFTPCFIDVWIASVAVFGIVFGVGALVWLLKKRAPRPDLPRNWHYWTKQSILSLVIFDVCAQLGIQIWSYSGVWMGDFRVWTTAATVVSLGIIFAIQGVEHTRLRNANAVVLLYWSGLLVAFTVKLRSLVSQKVYSDNPHYFVAYCVGFAAALAAFLVEWLWPRHGFEYEALVDDEECPAEHATIFSRLTYSWMTPMMKRGYSAFLTEDDLWALAKDDTAKESSNAFKETWEYELKHRSTGPSVWIALAKAYGGPYAFAAVYKLANDVSQFAQPQLLRFLIRWIDSWHYGSDPQPIIKGIVIALGMFAMSIIQTVAAQAYFQRSFVTGMRIKAGLSSAIYRKSLRLSNEGRALKTAGEIVNHMAIDSQRLQDAAQFLHQLWSSPLQIVICMLSLYDLVGWSVMAGVAVMIVSMPAQGFIVNIMKKLQVKQMKNKDVRVRLVAEIVANMKSIKLFAWGSAFMNKLNYVRNEQELKTLRKIGATQAVANFTWTTAPFFVSCFTFMAFVLSQDKPLTAEIVFASLTLFNLLTFPLAVLPMIISTLAESAVAAGRLKGFFMAEEVQENAISVGPAPTELGEETVVVKDASFSWDRHEDKIALRNFNFRACKGELLCVVGRVGTGKSSFLQAILGDLYRVSGSVRVNGDVAYVAQQSWILNATVRENITFGYRFDADFYNQTVKACALIDDLAALPDGDETVVGERGISLSGGQKARLALARAVYARADIYLFDDVLSAVDSHVGKHIIENVLGPRGLLASKTRVLATNSIVVLRHATYIIMLKDGEIAERGTYQDLMATKSQVSELVKSARQDRTSGSSSGGSSSETSTVIEGRDNDSEADEDVGELVPIKTGPPGAPKPRTGSMTTLRRASAASFKGHRGKLTDEEAATNTSKTKQAKEHVEQGKVNWDVYIEYAKNSRVSAVALYLVMITASTTSGIGASFWLKEWAKHNQEFGGNSQAWKYIGIYFAIGIGTSLLTMVQNLVLWIFCSIEASRKLHERMAIAIFRSPMSFFDTTPAGRILNRFSVDMNRVDEVLARSFNFLFNNAARSAFTLVIICVSTPAFVALVVPLCLSYLWIQRYYLRTSRELKRLDSASKSPVYSHFQESLGGISTIRAYRQVGRFVLENEWRLDANMRAYFPSISSNRWLAVRLEIIGATVILAAATFAIVSVANGSPLSSGMVGLAMSYALQITTSLGWIVRQTVEVETNIVSVERVLEYARLPSEAAEIVPERRPAAAWPAHGAVEFRNFSTRYRENLDLVLKDINVAIGSHEKIGVVGRTGAGKSSLTLSLFRIIEAAKGNVSIDDVDTSRIGLLDLRRRLAIIPQDAALFEGTMRNNLDPGHVHEDAELWDVLEHARLRDHVLSMEGGLDAMINEGGLNLSQGQRQLVSLARAMLTPSNILILDEATASVDIETDALVQETLRSPLFAHRTIITIAHRINTIMDSDRVLVLDKGQVAEYDSPAKLLEKKGAFYELVKQAGLDTSGASRAPSTSMGE